MILMDAPFFHEIFMWSPFVPGLPLGHCLLWALTTPVQVISIYYFILFYIISYIIIYIVTNTHLF